MREFGSHLSISGGVDKAVDRAEPLELTCLQVFTKNASQWAAKPLDPDVVERFKEKLEASPLKQIVSHDSYLINIASPDDGLWEKSIDALKTELDRCDILGIPWLVSHPGAQGGKRSRRRGSQPHPRRAAERQTIAGARNDRRAGLHPRSLIRRNCGDDR